MNKSIVFETNTGLKVSLKPHLITGIHEIDKTHSHIYISKKDYFIVKGSFDELINKFKN